jgi:hypothetical protein
MIEFLGMDLPMLNRAIGLFKGGGVNHVTIEGCGQENE